MSLHVKRTSYTQVTINITMQTHPTAVKISNPSELGNHGKEEKEKTSAITVILKNNIDRFLQSLL